MHLSTTQLIGLGANRQRVGEPRWRPSRAVHCCCLQKGVSQAAAAVAISCGLLMAGGPSTYLEAAPPDAAGPLAGQLQKAPPKLQRTSVEVRQPVVGPALSLVCAPGLAAPRSYTGAQQHWALAGTEDREEAAVTDAKFGRRLGPGGFHWRGWEERMAADPQFGFKICVELVIGVSATVLGDMATRPNFGLRELDFVFATLAVSSLVNFSLMWLLAPTLPAEGAPVAAAATGALEELFSDHYLAAWGAPAGNAFELGFPLGKRLVNLGYKGALFSMIGLGAGVAGTALSNGLLALRKRLDPGFEPQNAPPSVLGNAASWAVHMGLSANLRYQLINGLDLLLQPLLPTPLFQAYSFLLRSVNNVLGGASFALTARLLGVQKAPQEGEEEKAASGSGSRPEAAAQPAQPRARQQGRKPQ